MGMFGGLPVLLGIGDWFARRHEKDAAHSRLGSHRFHRAKGSALRQIGDVRASQKIENAVPSRSVRAIQISLAEK